MSSKVFYSALLFLHLLDIGMDAYFFYTVKVRYEEFYKFQLAFLILPFILVILKHLYNLASVGIKMTLLNILIDWLGINNVWEPQLGWFPCDKSNEYKELNHVKRLLFYICEDLPQLTIKILNLMYTGDTISFVMTLSISIQLFGLFYSTFKLQRIPNAKGIFNQNNLQIMWALFLWIYFPTIHIFLMSKFFHFEDNRPDWVLKYISESIENNLMGSFL